MIFNVNIDGEECKFLSEYPGYAFSENGNIYSFYVSGSRLRIDYERKPRKLKLISHYKSKYIFHVLYDKSGILRYQLCVHRLICEAFNGPPNPDDTCSHIDGNRINNNYKNLIWESMSDNHKRKLEHGTHDIGVNNSRALIKDEKIIEKIRELLSYGELTHEEIGAIFGVSRVFVTKINCGYRYKKL